MANGRYADKAALEIWRVYLICYRRVDGGKGGTSVSGGCHKRLDGGFAVEVKLL